MTITENQLNIVKLTKKILYTYTTGCGLRNRQQNIPNLLKINHKTTDFWECQLKETY